MNARRLTLVASVLGGAALAGCANVDTGALPSNPTAQLDTYIKEARDALRAESALDWASSNVAAQKLTSQPAPIAAFTDAVCDGRLDVTLIVVDKLGSFNHEVAQLAGAPGDSFAAYMEAIATDKQAIKAAQAGHPSQLSAEDLLRREDARCRAAVARDLGIGQPGVQMQSFIAVVAAFQALIAIPQQLLKVYESKERAAAVRGYIVANRPELTKALDALGKDGGLMQQSLDVDRRYLLRKTYVAYSEAGGDATGLARVHAGEDFARYVNQYMRIRDVDGQKLIEDPDAGIRAAYDKLVASAEHPDSNPYRALDDFLLALKNLTDLHEAVGNFNDARKAAAG